MIVAQTIFETKLKEMTLHNDIRLGKVSHVCLKPGASHFLLSPELMRMNPDFVAENK